MVNGITGKKISYVDVFSVLALSIHLSLNNENSIYLILFIIAMIFLKVININPKLIIWAAIISVGIFIIGILSGYLPLEDLNYSNIINSLAMFLGVLSFIFINYKYNKRIKDDRGRKVYVKRITLGQLFYGVTVLLLFLFQDISLNNQIIYISVIVGTLVYSLIYNLIRNNNKL